MGQNINAVIKPDYIIKTTDQVPLIISYVYQDISLQDNDFQRVISLQYYSCICNKESLS